MQPPIVVDLDGTLVRTDTLWEALLHLLRHRPWRLLWLPLWFLRGRAYGKTRLLAEAMPDVELLPYRREVLDWLRKEREQGRQIILATASPVALGEAIARKLSLFDAVLASTDRRNLRGREKLQAIRELLGQQPFEYLGNSRVDSPLWTAAIAAHVVGSRRFVRRMRRRFPHGRDFLSQHRWRALLRLMRPHQWVKNLLVFVPIMLAHRLTEWQLWKAAAVAFAALSLVASGLYVLNDLLDIEADRQHPRKRHRPLASGEIPLWAGILLMWGLVSAGLLLAVETLPTLFLVALLLYAGASMLYSFWLKTLPLVDVVVLAGLYTVRVLAGGWATQVPLSGWLLTFAIFLFLSLGFLKRYAELRLGLHSKLPRRGYAAEDEAVVRGFGTSSGFLAVLVFVLYVSSPAVQQLYRQPQWLWLTTPLWVYWITHLWLVAHRRQMHDDPLLFVLRDPISYATAAGIALLMVLSSL